MVWKRSAKDCKKSGLPSVQSFGWLNLKILIFVDASIYIKKMFVFSYGQYFNCLKDIFLR